MSTDRRILLATVAVATLAIGACGAAGQPSASSRVLSLMENTGAAAEPAIYPQPTFTYVLDGPLANLGPEAAVRRLVGHDVTTVDLGRIIGALKMRGTPQRTETGWELRNGDALLTVWTNSGLTAIDYSSAGGAVAIPGSAGGGSAGSAGSATASSDNPSTAVSSPPTISPIAPPPTASPTPTAAPTMLPASVDLPSPNSAASTAQSLLNGFGVLSGQQWTQSVSDAGGVAVSCTPGAKCTPIPATVTARMVTFDLVVDGVTVPDVSWSVTVGAHGSIESVWGTWARPESAGTYPLRSTQKVFDDLRAGKARYVGPQPLPAIGAPGASVAPGSLPAVVVHITGVSLGMARWNGMEKAQPVVYLLPTYRFQAHVAGGSPYEIELLALDPATFSFVSGPAPGGAGGGVPPIAPVSQPGKAPEPTSATAG
ncbi:MAG: hypothetical protein ACHQ4F_06935 [Candidatus Dormibacteria bacterium]